MLTVGTCRTEAEQRIRKALQLDQVMVPCSKFAQNQMVRCTQGESKGTHTLAIVGLIEQFPGPVLGQLLP